MSITPGFWAGRRVLLTGHTGFKGAWMALWLETMGAKVHGLSLEADTTPSLFEHLAPTTNLTSHIGDIRKQEFTRRVVEESDPEIVIHMAAQSLVRRSYRCPVETLSTNVMGTITLLESLRNAPNLTCALVVTSDKVYRNLDAAESFKEDAPLGGDDPYSASKAAQELVTHSWAKSFFSNDSSAIIATARAGNVIGGGDFSDDRLIPDIWRAHRDAKPVTLRHPEATRPWQHVLDLLSGYFSYIEHLCSDSRATLPRSLNFGPPPGPQHTVGEITSKMLNALDAKQAPKLEQSALAEKTSLSVDARMAIELLSWLPRLDIDEALALTTDWYKAFNVGQDMRAYTLSQIKSYMDRL